MLNQQGMTAMWDTLRLRHGILLRLIEALPEDKLHSRPIPQMRTPAELIAHVYDVVVKAIPEGVAKGQVTADESAETGIASGLKTKRDLLAYMDSCWKAGSQAVSTTTDQHLAAMVPTPWGRAMPGFALYSVAQDEYMHHHGQLFAFARALGVEPPMMWDFANNAEAYRPKQAATA